MNDKFDKHTSDIVEKIADGRITVQSDSAELKKALTLSVAAYMDYRHYGNVIGGLIEDFDESLEHFDPNVWFFGEAAVTDDLYARCNDTLDKAVEAFDELMERAKRNCSEVVKAALSVPTSVQSAVLGRAYPIKPEELDEKLCEIFESLDEVDYHHAIPENVTAFLELINELWPV